MKTLHTLLGNYVLRPRLDGTPLSLAKARSLYATPGLIGAVIVLPLVSFNPSPGVYDPSMLDQHVAIMPQDMNLVVGLAGGFCGQAWMPAAVGPTGCVSLNVSQTPGATPTPSQFPFPANQIVVQAYEDAIAALAAHLTAAGLMSRVVAVRVLGTFQGSWNPRNDMPDEGFYLPNDGSPECFAAWAAAGFTGDLIKQSWLSQLDFIAAAFPSADLLLTPYEPPHAFPMSKKDSEALLNSMIAAAAAKYGQRFRVVDVAASNGVERQVFPYAASQGASLGEQFNTWGPGGEAMTGTWSTPGVGGQQAITEIVAAAEARAGAYPPWLEWHPQNVQYMPSTLAAATPPALAV